MKSLSIFNRSLLIVLVGMFIFVSQMTTFAAEEENLGSLSGMVWQDSNNNGILEPQEQTLAGYPVYLQRTGSEVIGTVVAVVHTDSEGSFVFENLEAGSYQVFTETGDYHLVEVKGITASTIVDLPQATMHRIFLPLTVR